MSLHIYNSLVVNCMRQYITCQKRCLATSTPKEVTSAKLTT